MVPVGEWPTNGLLLTGESVSRTAEELRLDISKLKEERTSNKIRV